MTRDKTRSTDCEEAAPDVDVKMSFMKEDGGDIEGIGRFWFHKGTLSPMKSRRLREIHSFFDETVMRKLLIPVVSQTYDISLRLLDYTMTIWAKKTRVMAVMNTRNGPFPLNVFSHYKNWLHFFRRRGFDSFRRGERIYFRNIDDPEDVLTTTVAQLNFLRWAEMYGIMEYVKSNKKDIEADMIHTLGESKKRRRLEEEHEKNKAAPGSQALKRCKRTELSQGPSTKCIVYPILQNITFECNGAY